MNDKPAGFGTFAGVFTPCVLTILGVIMFLRFGQVVGQAGLLQCILIILVAKVITTLTAVSLSATATNTRVEGGGAYFLISRSLGVEYGGAIGLVFFIAQAISVSMYVIGFTEACLAAFPELGLSARQLASIVNLVVFACVYIGAGWTIRFQYGILALLVLSLLSFGIGSIADFSLVTLTSNLTPAYSEGSGFFLMFALFFPAVTGIMAGANMSGDLAEPGKAIPQGTFAAISVTALVYLVLAFLLAGSSARDALVNNSQIIESVSRWPFLIIAGVFAATLSSALGSMMGAPRILQALAKDRIFSQLRLFAKGEGKNNEPRRAILLTLVIAQCGVMLGDLDLIAPIITMFFMLTYGTLNLACFYESFSGNPSFRPTFRFHHWGFGLAGALSCVAVMLLMAPLWAIIAVVCMVLLHWYVTRKEIQTRWGDVRSGYAYERARRALLRLEEKEYHPKNWRPSILAVRWGKWPEAPRVAEYASWLGGEHGIVTLAEVAAGEVENRMPYRHRAEGKLQEFVRTYGLDSFYAVVVEKNQTEGIKSLLQSHGIGGFRPNTLLVSWDEIDAADQLADAVSLGRNFGCSVVAVRPFGDRPRWKPAVGPIDVWWKRDKNGELMLTLAHVLTCTHHWRDRPIRVFHVAGSEADQAPMEEALRSMLADARISARIQVIVSDDIGLAIAENSIGAAVTFLGLDPPVSDEIDLWYESATQLSKLERDIVFVSSTGDVDIDA